MNNYEDLSLEKLQYKLEETKSLLIDNQDERAFIAKQSGMHLSISFFTRLDKEIEKYEKQIEILKHLIEGKRT